MLTVTDQQPTSEEPLLLQSDVRLELTAADSAPATPLSLLVGVPPRRSAGNLTKRS